MTIKKFPILFGLFLLITGIPSAAKFYTDWLTDIFGGIVMRKNRARGNRLTRFAVAVAGALEAFRAECSHECGNRKDADGNPCHRPHLITFRPTGPAPEEDGPAEGAPGGVPSEEAPEELAYTG